MKLLVLCMCGGVDREGATHTYDDEVDRVNIYKDEVGTVLYG